LLAKLQKMFEIEMKKGGKDKEMPFILSIA
jgi:hypothetical protein